jgi:hypothetical protein
MVACGTQLVSAMRAHHAHAHAHATRPRIGWAGAPGQTSPQVTPPTRPSERDLRRAVDRLRTLSPAQAIGDAELNYALRPFRGHAPTALMCANATCTEPFVWCGLDSTTARVRFSATGPVDGRWDPTGGESAGVPVAQPGEPLLRWRFRCARCQRPSVLSNARMLTLVLRALAAGHDEITPAAE